MSERYRVGAPDGLTGPTTPSISGATVTDAVNYHEWENVDPDRVFRSHVVVTRGRECVAIFPWVPEEKRKPGSLSKDEAHAFAQMFCDAANAAECVPV